MKQEESVTAKYLSLIEEFKALRAELLWHMDTIERMQIYCLIIVCAVMGYGLQSSSPLMFALACGVSAYFWHRNRKHSLSVYKIGRYIANFIEPEMGGMHWERRIGLKITQDAHWRYPKKLLSKLSLFMMVPYPMFFLINTLLFLFYVRMSLSPTLELWQFITICVICVPILFYVSIKLAKMTASVKREYWDGVFQKIRDDENDVSKRKEI